MNKWITIAFVFFLAACGKKEQNGEHTSKRIQSLSDGKIVSENFGFCDTITTSGARIGIKIWESADTSSVARGINEIIRSKVIDRINSHADSASLDSVPGVRKKTSVAYGVFATNYKNFKADFPDAPGCWEIDIEGDTVMVTSKLLMYQIDHYAFTGGAHPNSFRSEHIFDATSGKELSPYAFVGDTSALLKIVEKQFRKTEKLSETADLEEAGYFLQNHQFFLPANFTFDRKGVVFYYNAYEIAAYVRGAIEFVIPYDQLQGIVNKEQIF